MPKIKQAPDGERTSVDGTEALPLSSSDSVSSWWTPISRIAEYVRTLTQTLTGKTINLSNNTLTGTTAQFNTALSDNDFATLAGAETLTNKTLTTPTIASFTNATHVHEAASSGGTLDEDALALTDVTTNNSATTKHGFLKKLDNTATNFMDGTGNWDSVKDSDLSTSDITTNNSTTSKHGFLPKLSGDSDTYLNGDGEFTTPTTSGSVATDAIWDAKGDLAVGTGANTAARLPVGTAGQVLSVDAGETTGLKWITGGGGITMDQADPYSLFHRVSGSDSDDDEFSTNTAANYTEVDPTGTTTWVLGTGHVASCVFNDQASGDVGALLKAITLADGESYETCISLLNKKATNVSLAGLVVTDGVLSSSNALAAQCYLGANADELMIDVRTGTLATLTTVGTSYTLASTSVTGKLKLRLKRNSSTSFTALISTIDGAQFSGFGLGNVNPGFTPTHAGLIVSIGGGASHECMAAFDYIRVV